MYGSSVLLPLTPANNYAPKVIIFGGGNPATATTELIDLSATTPAWTYGPSMSAPRIEMNATILPNGQVLTVGGSLNDEDTTTASLNADLYDPAANTMSSAGANAVPRLYHSVSLLLPDATVWVAGGNPTRGTYEPSVEIYSPAYLFNPNGTLATRPAITSVTPSVIGYGSSFQVQTPDAANIASIVSNERRRSNARVRYGSAPGRTQLYCRQRCFDGDWASQRKHRASGLLHVVFD